MRERWHTAQCHHGTILRMGDYLHLSRGQGPALMTAVNVAQLLSARATR